MCLRRSAKVVEFLRGALGGQTPDRGRASRRAWRHPNTARRSVVTPEIVSTLERFVPLAPLHQPNNLAPIRTILERLPQIPQVACFDTAFHRGHPELADRYAHPRAACIRRACAATDSTAFPTNTSPSRLQRSRPRSRKGKVVVAHLGSGASMCALVNWKQHREHDGLHGT